MGKAYLVMVARVLYLLFLVLLPPMLVVVGVVEAWDQATHPDQGA
jgi:hypothetical protein